MIKLAEACKNILLDFRLLTFYWVAAEFQADRGRMLLVTVTSNILVECVLIQIGNQNSSGIHIKSNLSNRFDKFPPNAGIEVFLIWMPMRKVLSVENTSVAWR